MHRPAWLRRSGHRLLDPVSKFCHVMSLPAGAAVLDVGCGNHSPAVLKRLNPRIRYFGIDVEPYNLDEADFAAAEEIHLCPPGSFAAGIGRWDAAFDLIVCSHTIEHVDDPDGCLTAMAAALRPGGKLHLTFPSRRSAVLPSRRGSLNFRDDPSHREIPDPEMAVSLLEGRGLRLTLRRDPHRPAVLGALGLLNEPLSAAKRVARRGTWAWWGFETLLVFERPTRRVLSIQPVADGGGSEHALIAMVRQLSTAGWECHVAVPASASLEGRYRSAGAELHVVPMASLTTSAGWSHWLRFAALWPVTVARLAALTRSIGADVVHTNSLHSWYGWAVALWTGRPHLWHAREIVFQSPLALKVERSLARRFATRVVAVSNAVAAQLDPLNVVVVLDDADPALFHPGRAGRFRAGEGIDDESLVIGSVARIDTWKGFDVLLDAFAEVVRSRPGAQLVIAGAPVAGKEAYAESLRRRAAALPGVRWLGPRSDVADLMADLDLFVQVSTHPEPFGLVVVEALACGTPVVAGAEGGPLETLGRPAADGPVPAGRLVRPGDPAAMAEAILSVLPPGPSSAGHRASRPRLRQPEPGRFPPLFDEVAGSSPRPPRRGTKRPARRRRPLR